MQSSSKLFEYLFSSCRTSFHLETERRQMQDVMSLAYLYLNRLIHYLPTSFITANSAELFFMVTRKLLVKKLEVPFIKYVINSEVSLLFLEGRRLGDWFREHLNKQNMVVFHLFTLVA